MKTKVMELRQKRAQMIAQARALLDKAEEENRDLTAEEQNNWDAAMADADKAKEQYERLERQMAYKSGFSFRNEIKPCGLLARLQTITHPLRDVLNEIAQIPGVARGRGKKHQ